MLKKIPKSEASTFCSSVANRENYPFIYAIMLNALESEGTGRESYSIEWNTRKANASIRELSK